MSDILASIIEGAVEAAAAANERRRGGAKSGRRFPQPVAVAPVRAGEPAQTASPPPAPRRPGAPAKAAAAPPEPAAGGVDVRSFLRTPQSLIRTVLAGEILGPPIALRRQNLWDGPRV